MERYRRIRREQSVVISGMPASSQCFSLRIARILTLQPAAEQDQPVELGQPVRVYHTDEHVHTVEHIHTVEHVHVVEYVHTVKHVHVLDLALAPTTTTTTKSRLLALPVHIRRAIVKHCVASPFVSADGRYEIAGPTVDQKGAISATGRLWTPTHIQPYLVVRAVCRSLRDDAARVLGQANVFKIKYPGPARQWLHQHQQLGPAGGVQSLRAVTLTVASLATARKTEKYPGLLGALTTTTTLNDWHGLMRDLAGVPLEELHVNFAEWTRARNKLAFDERFWAALGRVTVTKTLTLEGSYPREGVVEYLGALFRRNPGLVFVDEGDQYDWEDDDNLCLYGRVLSKE